MNNTDIKKINKNLETIDENFEGIITVISDDRAMIYSICFNTLLNSIALIYIIYNLKK